MGTFVQRRRSTVHWNIMGTVNKSKTSAPLTRRISVASGYNIWATIYDTENNPLIALEKIHYPIDRVKPCVDGGIVVDIGCGTGRNIGRMLKLGASTVIGLDISEGMLEVAKKRFEKCSKVKLRRHNLLESKFPEFIQDKSVAAVTACLMLEHIPLNRLNEVFREVRRVLKPGGYMVVTEMHPWLWDKGGEAQFTASSGGHVIVKSYRKPLSGYLTAALESGLDLVAIKEVPMDEDVATTSSRANHFLDNMMLLWYIMARPKKS